jgi:ABC-type nitrate/sulfonate/bicarbonate transport system substrate-binding protein
VSLAALLTSCAASAATTASSPPASSSAAAGSSTTAPTPATVTLALSWTPNTDYTGIYVAQAKGYFADQGLTVKVLPYGSTAPETLVSRGLADFGFSYQAGIAYAHAAGADLVSVFAPDQKGTYAIAVRADRADITSPKDLDGKTYAGFGTPDEGPELQYVIKHAGGTGTFKTVTLNTSAYQALYAGKVDFTIPVVTWEGVEASLVGKPIKTFSFTDYGFPDQYSVLIASSTKYLKANPDVARRFLAAVTKGYAYAADNPADAAQTVISANPGVFSNPELVLKSEALLASGGYLKNAQGGVGTQDATEWSKYGGFLYSNGLLVDGSGAKLTSEPDWTTYYTNAYLPTAP